MRRPAEAELGQLFRRGQIAFAIGDLESPADAKDFDGVAGKFEKYFSPGPGTGD